MRLGLASLVAFAGAVWVGCSAPPPASLEFVDQSPAQPKLGEITTLRFKAMDARGQPQVGALVTFELQSAVPGVDLSPLEASTNTDGTVTTQLVAQGGRVTSAVVVARAEDKSSISPVITFAGAGATSRQLTFQCGKISGEGSGGVHAIGAYDETRHLIAGVKLRCNAHVADRNGDGIPGAQVSFLAEAGTIGPSSVSVTNVVGNAEVLYKTSLPLPQDVDPGTFTWTPLNDVTHTGEYIAPLWMHPFTWVRNPIADWDKPGNPQLPRDEPFRPDPIRPGKINNPRDNLVSMIAITTGEEAYDDNNNNGKWDTNEPFVDLTEPFVDNNDNGTWDAGERFVDNNGNGLWDGKNGKYDVTTLIWVQERILWTGAPHAFDRTGEFQTVRQLSPLPGVLMHVPHFGAATSTFLLADPWFTAIARNSADDGCTEAPVGPIIVETVSKGIAFTYPSYNLVSFTVKDQHDPASENPPAPFPAAVPFEVSADCKFTASPEEGHGMIIASPLVQGDVL